MHIYARYAWFCCVHFKLSFHKLLLTSFLRPVLGTPREASDSLKRVGEARDEHRVSCCIVFHVNFYTNRQLQCKRIKSVFFIAG